MTHNNYIYIAVMALVSYAIRILPLTLIRKPIKNRFIQSFLYYVPYVTLAVIIGQSALHLAAGTAAPEVAAANHNADLHAQLMGFLHAAADGVHGGLIKARSLFAAQCFAADLEKDTLIFQCHNPNTACSIFRRAAYPGIFTIVYFTIKPA